MMPASWLFYEVWRQCVLPPLSVEAMAAELRIGRWSTLGSGDVSECYRAFNVLTSEDSRALPLHRDPDIGHVHTDRPLLSLEERIGGSMHLIRSLECRTRSHRSPSISNRCNFFLITSGDFCRNLVII